MSQYPIDRDLSWLEFNRRVLHEARDPLNPLLERVRFLGIFHRNLDEFFMKRVGGLRRQMDAGIEGSGDRLAALSARIRDLLHDAGVFVTHEFAPALERQEFELVRSDGLSGADQVQLAELFRNRIFPVLTPLLVDPSHPFPFLSNLSTSIGVLLRDLSADPTEEQEPRFARIKVPPTFPTWIRLTGSSQRAARFYSLHDLVMENLSALFPAMAIVAAAVFRITRNADLERDEEDAEDLLDLITQELRERRFAKVIRIQYMRRTDAVLLERLTDELELSEADLYQSEIPLDLFDLDPLLSVNRSELKFPPAEPAIPPPLDSEDTNILSLIRNRDLLVHHPYESFHETVERFIRTAVEDPRALAIKMTIYRTGEESPFLPLLIQAAEQGKQVACLVELKARFDEERNIRVAQALEKAGVHVVYGIVGLKTHCKIALVVRQEEDGVVSYAHIGTGNYNARTARVYTDLGLFTAKPEFVQDVVLLFHALTGGSLNRHYRKLLVAPLEMKQRFIGLIDRESLNATRGLPARIVAKMNSLEDSDICAALERASQAGVQVDLIIRGVCILRPGIPDVSERIRVRSIVGRFLEHSRIFYFANAESDPVRGSFYIGSADWMHRNLEARVESVVPIEEPDLRAKCWEILDLMLRDHRKGWELLADGVYEKLPPVPSGGHSAQELLLELTQEKARQIEELQA